jgi:hypothetical protein
VDYTFCEPDGRPLLSIEYDGLGEGFSRNGSYTPTDATPPHRKLKMDFKLEVAKTAGYPLAVVSSEETTVIEPDSSVVILDGMVGEFLARRDAWRLAEEMIEERRDFIDSLPPDEQSEVIQDLVTDAEVLADLDNDPLEAAISRWEFELGILNPRVEHFWDPPERKVRDYSFMSLEAIDARMEAMKNAERVGCRVVIDLPGAAAVRTIWVRNVGPDLGLMTKLVAGKIARYLALKQARAMTPEA